MRPKRTQPLILPLMTLIRDGCAGALTPSAMDGDSHFWPDWVLFGKCLRSVAMVLFLNGIENDTLGTHSGAAAGERPKCAGRANCGGVRRQPRRWPRRRRTAL